MKTKNDYVKASDLFKIYEAFHPGEQFSNEDIYHWGLEQGYEVKPPPDAKAAAIKKIKEAVKKSVMTDPQGRQVSKYIYVGDEGGQLPLWSELAITPQPVVQRSVNDHRAKGIQTLVTGRLITDSYNDNFNLGEPVEFSLAVEDDVIEQMIMRKLSKGKGLTSDEDSEEEGDE